MLVLFAVLALAAATPEATAAEKPAEAAAKADSEKKICQTKTKMGTRFKERICYTKAEYERRQLEERQALDRMQRIPGNCQQTGGC
ncbi:hypothetical protein [Phenylobacterium sp.]|jgi:hypothetical protein|uniref:hypothetical protein n=1 Tax=Phenylobacterium sp. TaxID=1871053 RepID=UPI002F938397